jgi:type IV pilus assembly protein PilB
MRQIKRLGDLLVEDGLLSREILESSIEENKNSGMKLGQFLVSSGVVAEDRIVESLSRQLGIPQLSADDMQPGALMAELIPQGMADQYQIVPLRDEAIGLVCAMIDPMDLQSLERVEEIVNKPVDPVICTSTQFKELCKMLYGGSYAKNFETLFDGMESESSDTVAVTDVTAGPSDQIEVRSLLDMAEGAPVIRMVNWMLATGASEDASDIHISPERTKISLRMRVDGRLRDYPAPPKSMHLSIISRIKILAQMDIAVSRVPQDGRFAIKVNGREINIRASCTPTVNGENMVLRILDMSGGILSLDQLGFEPEIERKVVEVMTKPHGMFLTTGPTGGGKSTTLYSLLNLLNKPDVNIITTEDPVEYRMEGVRQIELNPKAGMTFASALRSILRQDPDIVMVGEIRDAETARIAVQAALTGHQVLSTLHTNSASGAVTRLVDMGIEPFLAALVCNVVVSQRLIRRLCSDCARPFDPSDAALESWKFTPRERAGATFMEAVGCPRCKQVGYKSRAGIYETLFFNDQIREMIIQRRSALEIDNCALECGVLTPLKYSASRKVLAGISTLEEALSKIMD